VLAPPAGAEPAQREVADDIVDDQHPYTRQEMALPAASRWRLAAATRTGAQVGCQEPGGASIEASGTQPSCPPVHRHQEGLRFLKLIDAAVPKYYLDLHLVLGNYATHKTSRRDQPLSTSAGERQTNCSDRWTARRRRTRWWCRR
jgi:hypothetical protein